MYRPVCYALFENERGESVIEPVVSFYDDDGPTGTPSARFCLASEVPGRDVWTMSQHGARFEYALVGADEDAINGSCEEGFYVKTVLPEGEHVLMEKKVSGY